MIENKSKIAIDRIKITDSVCGMEELDKWKIFTVSPMPMIIVSYPAGVIFAANDSFAVFSRCSSQEIIGYTDLELGIWVNPNEREKVISCVKRHHNIRNVEVSIRRRPDAIRIALLSCEQVFLSNQPYLLVWFNDITELKQVQQELWSQKQEFRMLLENLPDIVGRVNKEYRYLYISPAIEIMTGISAATFIGRTMYELGFDEDLCAQTQFNICQVFETGQKAVYERCFEGVDGCQYYHQVYLAPECTANGDVEYVLFHIRNITSIKEAEKALIKSEETQRRILEAFPDLLFLINGSGVFLDYKASKEALLYTPPEIFIGKKVIEILPVQVAEKIMYYIKCALEKDVIEVFEYELMIQERLMTFEARIVCATNADEVLFIVRDITKLKLLETTLARFDRLNTVGEMAAGIAHELRNPLTTVRGFLQILSNKPESSCFKEQFSLMIDELDRANSIITEYLSLARNKVMKLEYHNISSIIESLAPLIKADATNAGKQLSLLLGATSDILLEPKEIRQLLLNLARNGLEAMQPGNTLTIKTYQENGEVVLAVQDQGTGIEKQVLDKIGTPFFTTKDQGNGLGLSICHTIAVHHDAEISIDTSPNGTTFFVRFKIKK